MRFGVIRTLPGLHVAQNLAGIHVLQLTAICERTQLFFPPPDSPEVNPDELVWKAVKITLSVAPGSKVRKICTVSRSVGCASSRSDPIASAAFSGRPRSVAPLRS